MVKIGTILILLTVYAAPSYFDFRELANIATIEANQGKPIQLTKSLILGIAVDRFPEKSCVIFRWESCMTFRGCEYLEYSKDLNRTKSCYFEGASLDNTYNQEWKRYFYD